MAYWLVYSQSPADGWARIITLASRYRADSHGGCEGHTVGSPCSVNMIKLTSNSPRDTSSLCLLHVVRHASVLGRPSNEGPDRSHHSRYEATLSPEVIVLLTERRIRPYAELLCGWISPPNQRLHRTRDMDVRFHSGTSHSPRETPNSFRGMFHFLLWVLFRASDMVSISHRSIFTFLTAGQGSFSSTWTRKYVP